MNTAASGMHHPHHHHQQQLDNSGGSNNGPAPPHAGGWPDPTGAAPNGGGWVTSGWGHQVTGPDANGMSESVDAFIRSGSGLGWRMDGRLDG